MIFEEDVEEDVDFGKHIYVNIGSKQVIAVYLGYYDQEQSWIAVVVKHPYDENDISFKKILIYNSLIEGVVPDDIKNSDIPIKLIVLPGNSGQKIAYYEYVEWILKTNKLNPSSLFDSNDNKFIFVRQHHPFEAILKQLIN